MKHEVLRVLARCRVLEESMMEPLMNMSSSVAEALVDELLVSKVSVKEGFRLRTFYELTSKGESYIKQNMPEIKEFYRGFNLEQDLTLCDFYLRRSDKEKDSWITRDDFIKKYKLPGTVDGAFVNVNGRLEAVKTIHQNSDFSSVERVESFLRATEIEDISYILFTKT
ncbi:hypothetical protein ACFVS2_25300 [Brevibacillus sp. NPDC058079]|uniref:hypothetical protein n=1 Tax=Brevibacillus sp. NPDC058079 TaxID=3346330 RepID=UPI0036EA2628